MNPERLELLRKREELLKFKEKLIQVKNKWQNQLEETSSTTTNHLQLKWHNGLLAVLKNDQIILKSFNGTWRGDKVLKLPENSDEMIFYLKTNCIAISCKQDDLRYKNYWIPLDRSDSNWVGLPEDARQRIESIQVLREDAKVIRALMFEDQKKVLTIINERMEILEEIEEVERILESNESDCSSVLLIKSDKSLSILNPFTLDETIYLPHASKSSKFNFKQIVHFKYDTDASLFLVLCDHFGGKLRMFLCGTEGSSEMASISIPKG